MLAVIILFTTTITLIIALVSVFVSQRDHFEFYHRAANNQSKKGNDGYRPLNNYSDNYCLTPDCVKVAASVIEAIDLTVDPCDDFYVSKRAESRFHFMPVSLQTLSTNHRDLA